MNPLGPQQTATEPWLTETFRQGLSQLGLTLSDDQVRQFQIYERELEEWNRRFNLTRITGRERVQTHHFLDSLTAVLAIPPEIKAGGRIIDVATGAGFPGIPLKIALPGLRLTLVDSVGKKATFLEYLLDALELPDVQLLLERAETLAHARLWQDVSSAVSDFWDDLKEHGRENDTLILVWSEFGRRIQDNGTGTDHGSGGSAFVVGGGIKGGLYGEYPSLKERDHLEGDLHFNNDFRSTYSSILDAWLGLDPVPIVRGGFEQMDFVREPA